jgi:Protein kinase domain
VINQDSFGDLGGFTAGSRVGKYLIEQQIGRGGMAAVFRARDAELGRVVALKVLAPALAADEGFRQRFVRESRAAAAVDDPHIIPLYEAGEAGGVLFIAMRYVSGGDVRSLLFRQGSLTPEQVAAIVPAVASALDAAHAAGLVHRDVKPANMLLDSGPGRPDHVYLSDFGLSKEAAGSIGLTGTGLFLGTVDYAAPEQIEGRPVDGRTDQYALGCAAFEMLSGAPPFRRDHGMAVLAAHLSQAPPRLSALKPSLPPGLDPVFAKVLAKSPGDRYRTCGEFGDALREVCGYGRYDGGSAGAGELAAGLAAQAGRPPTELAWNAYPGPVPEAGPGPGSAPGSVPPGLVSPGSVPPGSVPAAPVDALTGAAQHIVPGFGSQPSYPPPPQLPPAWVNSGPVQRSGSSRWVIAACAGIAAAVIVAAGIIFAAEAGSSSSTNNSSGGGVPTVTVTATSNPTGDSSPNPDSTSVVSPDNQSASSQPVDSPSPPSTPPNTPPVNSQSAWMAVMEPNEFTVDLPSGWTQMPSIDSDSVEFGDSTGDKVIVDWTPWSTDAVTHQHQVSQDLVRLHPAYQEISIRSARYRDYEAADWLFTDDNSAGQPVESIDRAFIVDSGATYAIELIAPTGQYQAAYDSIWPKVLASFEPEG